MKKAIGGIVAALVIVFGIIAIFVCTEKVPAGYVGVVYNMSGGVNGEVLSQGFHVVSPTKKVTTYSIGLEQSYLTKEEKGDSSKDESFSIPTSDGKTVRVDLEFSYKFDPERVTDTFIKFKGRSGREIKDTFIKPKIMAWTQEISAQYPVTDIFGDKRTEINSELDKYLKEKFEPYGIVIDTVNFTDIVVDAETEKAIQKKVNAQQELELAKIESDTAKVQAEKDKNVAEIAAEKDKAVAEIEAEKNIIEAEGKAKAKRIAAEADADANKKISESLTPELLERQKYSKWDGKLPQITSDSTIIKDFK